MAIDPPPPNKERDRLQAIVDHSARRVERAAEKIDAAAGEMVDAKAQATRAQAALDAWLKDNPDPQGSLL